MADADPNIEADPEAEAKAAKQARIDARYAAIDAGKNGVASAPEAKKDEPKARRGLASLSDADYAQLDEVAPEFGKKMRGFVSSISDAIADRDAELDGIKGLNTAELKKLATVADSLAGMAQDHHKAIDRAGNKAFDALAKNGLAAIVGENRTERMSNDNTLAICRDLYGKAARLRDDMDGEITLEESIIEVGKRRFPSQFKNTDAVKEQKDAIRAVETTASIRPGRTGPAPVAKPKDRMMNTVKQFVKARKGD